jgi:hypothetical protein
VKCPLLLPDFNQNWYVSTDYSITLPVSNFMKIRSAVLQMLQGNRRTDKQILAVFAHFCIEPFRRMSCEPGWRSRYRDCLLAGRPRGRSPGRVRIFSMSSRLALGPIQPPIQWVPGGLFKGVKRQGREANRSSPASAEVKKMWIYTSTPPYAFMA